MPVSKLKANSNAVVAKELRDSEVGLQAQKAKLMQNCRVGDIRVSYQYYQPQAISVLAQQYTDVVFGKTFRPFNLQSIHVDPRVSTMPSKN